MAQLPVHKSDVYAPQTGQVTVFPDLDRLKINIGTGMKKTKFAFFKKYYNGRCRSTHDDSGASGDGPRL